MLAPSAAPSCAPSNASSRSSRTNSTDVAGVIAGVCSTAVYRKKARLFVEGENPRGIFILRTGSARVTTCSTFGKTIVIRLAEPGDVLGLNAVVSNRPYGATAEMMANGQVDFIPRDSLLRLMKANEQFAFAIAEHLSASYYSLHEAIRALGLAIHPLERLAKLLLSWTSSPDDRDNSSDQSFKLPLTHQEIADNIGSTRQTVTKLFSELRRRNVLSSDGGELRITNRSELQRIVQF